MRISDWSSDVCSSDLRTRLAEGGGELAVTADHRGLRQEFRVAGGAADFLRHRIAVVGHVDARGIGGIVLAHLLGAVPQRHDPGRCALNQRLDDREARSEEHTSELQSLIRISYAVFRLK